MDNVIVRETVFNTKKGGKDIVIGQVTDIHINLFNEQDLKDEELVETKAHRLWLKDGASLVQAKWALDYCKDFDLTVLSGDILDFATTAARDAVKENIFSRENIMACIGGHDITKQMETAYENKTSLDARYAFLQDFWCNDIQYASKTLGEKVKVVVFNNNTELWKEHREPMNEEQYNLLLKDIEDARENNLIILLFCHEPIFTGVLNREVDKNFTGEKVLFRAAFENCDEISQKAYKLITSSSDVIKGVFCGHRHYDTEVDIQAGFEENGKFVKQNIKQYVLTSNVVQNKAHILKITIK